MTRKLLFPKRPQGDDTREPIDRFRDLSAKVMAVPKSEIDKREKKWQQSKQHSVTPPSQNR